MRFNTTLLFFFLLVPISGFIAWAGDKIGHRVGKRRHSLLGLRPRHTATLITIGAGVGIASASFGLMFAASEGFRAVVAHGSELLQTNQQLTRDNERMTVAVRDAGAKVRELRADADRAGHLREAAELARTNAQTRREQAESRDRAAQAKLRLAIAALETEKGRLGATQNSLRTAERRVSSAQAAVTSASARRLSAEAAARGAEAAAKKARVDAEQARGRVAVAERTFINVTQSQRELLEKQRTEIARQDAQLAEQTKQIAAQTNLLDETTARADRQRRELDRLTVAVSGLESRSAQTQTALTNLQVDATALRSRQITYRVGEEVARLSVIPGRSVSKVQVALEGLLTAAAKKAEGRGARTQDGAIRAVWIPEHKAASETGTFQTVSEMDTLWEASMSILRANEPVVVLVVASANAVAGQPVAVDLKTYRNPLVFSAGASLGEITLDGTHTRQEIADSLYTFLRGDVRRKLLEAGVIPISLGADDDAVGEAGIDSLVRVMDDVRSARKAKVTVRAARDLHAADPVALDFEVHAIEQPTGGSAR